MPLWYRNCRSSMLILQSLMLTAAFGYNFQRRKNFIPRIAAAAVSAMLIAYQCQHLIYIPGGTLAANVSHAVLSMINYLLLLGVILFSLKESGWNAIFLATMVSIGTSMAGCVKTLLRTLPLFNALTNDPAGIIPADLICYGGMALLLFRIFRFYTALKEDASQYRSKIIFSTAAVGIYLAMSWVIADYDTQDRQAVLVTNLTAVVILAMVYMIQFGVMERERLAGTVETMRELMYRQKEQYDTSRESVQLINEKYHDLKNMIGSIQAVLPDEEAERLRKSLSRYDVRVRTGLEVLDIVLTEKMDLCLQRGITLTCNLSGTDFSFMEELDVYTLFNNALSNAVNAVSELAEPGFIILLAVQEGNMVTIHVENPCPKSVTFADGLPQSGGDPDWHGFGMKSMVRTAEKYGGALSATQKDGRFRLDILLLNLRG